MSILIQFIKEDPVVHRSFVHGYMIVRVAHYTATKCANDYGIVTTMLSRFYVNSLGTYQLDHLRMLVTRE